MQVLAAHKKHVLARGKISCLGEVATVNVARGCAGACVFCYARCYTGAPDPGTLLVYHDLPGQLRREIDSRRRKRPLPGFVVFSSASDPFLGGPQVVDVARASIDVLLRRRIGVSLSTRGVIPDDVIQLLARSASRVRVTIPLASLSHSYHRDWEPGTATADQRLFLVQRLQEAGVCPNLHLEPVIPFVNDSTDDLRQLVSALAGLGIDRAMTSFLQLRRGVADQLLSEAPAAAQRLVLGCFPSQQHGRPADFDHVQPRQALATLRRIQRVGRDQGLRISACRCHNPGLPAGQCELKPADDTPPGQATMFDSAADEE